MKFSRVLVLMLFVTVVFAKKKRKTEQKKEIEEVQIDLACNMARSRSARFVIETVLYPQLKRRNYMLPNNCPLNASYDMYLKQDQHKLRKGRRNYQCGFCNKTFRSDRALDNHMNLEHPNEVYPGINLCLADYCEILQCDWFRFQRKGDRYSQKKQLQDICRPDYIHSNLDQCRILKQQCFPVHYDSLPKEIEMSEVFEELFCGAITCESKVRQEKLKKLWNERENVDVPYNVLLFMVFFALVVFYVIACVLWSQVKGRQGDIRRIHGKEGKWSWFTKKKKIY